MSAAFGGDARESANQSAVIDQKRPGEGYRLEGAEFVDGPWFDLGITAPVTISSSASQRFYRLVCE